MAIKKTVVARRAYNRALSDLNRDLRIARDAAQEVASVTGQLNDTRFVVWRRGLDFAVERLQRLSK